MDMENGRLALISFAELDTRKSLEEILAGLGFSLTVIAGESLLSQQILPAELPIVLLVDGQTYSQREIVAALPQSDQTPILGVFCGDADHWNRQLLNHCSEFVGWPSQAKEVAVRLERLQPQKTVTLDAKGQNLVKEFTDLKMIGRAPAFLAILHFIKKVANCDAPVLIEGETGTGKEIAAQAVHALSTRKEFPFIPVNCGAIPDNLLENELFGHEKGAFTDAKDTQAGVIAQADEGTLFLDEVDALSSKAQVALLRFLQDQEYRPLGSKRNKKANVRIITASNTNLSKLVEENQFRQDLLFRLNIMSIKLPPLRERIGDIPLLAQHFLRQYRDKYGQKNKYLHPSAIRWLEQQPWPGNIRELENLLHREFLIAETDTIYIHNDDKQAHDRRKNLADRRQNGTFNLNFSDAKAEIIADFEKKYLYWLMVESQGNVTLAAKRAGKERRALGKLLKKHQLNKNIQ